MPQFGRISTTVSSLRPAQVRRHQCGAGFARLTCRRSHSDYMLVSNTVSKRFQVVNKNKSKGWQDATRLSLIFSDQGVRLKSRGKRSEPVEFVVGQLVIGTRLTSNRLKRPSDISPIGLAPPAVQDSRRAPVGFNDDGGAPVEKRARMGGNLVNDESTTSSFNAFAAIEQKYEDTASTGKNAGLTTGLTAGLLPQSWVTCNPGPGWSPSPHNAASLWIAGRGLTNIINGTSTQPELYHEPRNYHISPCYMDLGEQAFEPLSDKIQRGSSGFWIG